MRGDTASLWWGRREEGAGPGWRKSLLRGHAVGCREYHLPSAILMTCKAQPAGTAVRSGLGEMRKVGNRPPRDRES